MTGPYAVEAADRCGVFRRRQFRTFDGALMVAEAWVKAYPNACVVIGNEDRADLYEDGLTYDERERLEAAAVS